jgi:tetratricopeptide (TPR) repeat protein
MSKKRTMVVVVSLLTVLLMTGCGQRSQAESYFKEGNYEEARELYNELQMVEKAAECTYLIAQDDLDAKQYEDAIKELETIPDYEGSLELLEEARYEYGVSLYEKKQYEDAMAQFEKIADYKDASDYMKKARYGYGIALYEKKQYEDAMAQFEKIAGYKDASDYINKAGYEYGIALYEKGQYEDAMAQFEKIADYNDTEDYMYKCRMGLKYADFDYDNFYAWDMEDAGALSHEDIQEYMENLMESMYTTWYYNDENGEEKELVIDPYQIQGKEYCILSNDAEAKFTGFYFCYEGDEGTSYHVNIAPDFQYVDVEESALSLEIADSTQDLYYCYNYDAETAAYYKQEQEDAQPKYTKEEVYEQAKQDVKDAIYSQLTAENIFSAIGFAASYTWIFDPVDSIRYEYDFSTKTHSLVFSVSLSEYGLSVQDTEKIAAQYMESDDGGLIRTALYSVE